MFNYIKLIKKKQALDWELINFYLCSIQASLWVNIPFKNMRKVMICKPTQKYVSKDNTAISLTHSIWQRKTFLRSLRDKKRKIHPVIVRRNKVFLAWFQSQTWAGAVFHSFYLLMSIASEKKLILKLWLHHMHEIISLNIQFHVQNTYYIWKLIFYIFITFHRFSQKCSIVQCLKYSTSAKSTCRPGIRDVLHLMNLAIKCILC